MTRLLFIYWVYSILILHFSIWVIFHVCCVIKGM